jgi:hypothetical protein
MQQVAAAPTQQIGACRVRSKWSAEALPSYIPQPRATSYPKAQPLGAVVDRQDNDAADLGVRSASALVITATSTID